LIPRDEEKLKEKVKKLTATCKAKVEYRVADFSKAVSLEFYTELYNSMKDLDVSILVNNFGMGGSGGFYECPPQNCSDQSMVNIVPQFMMTKLFFNHFRARSTQCAVIDVSSITSLGEYIDYALYGATESFNRAFSQNMQDKFGAEYGIDFLALKPGFVLTNIGDGVQSIKDRFNDTPDGKMVFTAEVCASSTLKALGNVWETYDCHCILGSVLDAFMWLTPAIQITQLCKVIGIKK
jgi:short-subunit dehydrogenase